MAQFDKNSAATNLKKAGGGGSSGAPATVSDRQILGLPLSKVQAIIDACPDLPHLRGPGQHAIDKALHAESTGDRRLMAEAERELADIIVKVGHLSREEQAAKLVGTLRRTVDRDQIGAWYSHLDGR